MNTRVSLTTFVSALAILFTSNMSVSFAGTGNSKRHLCEGAATSIDFILTDGLKKRFEDASPKSIHSVYLVLEKSADDVGATAVGKLDAALMPFGLKAARFTGDRGLESHLFYAHLSGSKKSLLDLMEAFLVQKDSAIARTQIHLIRAGLKVPRPESTYEIESMGVPLNLYMATVRDYFKTNPDFVGMGIDVINGRIGVVVYLKNLPLTSGTVKTVGDLHHEFFGISLRHSNTRSQTPTAAVTDRDYEIEIERTYWDETLFQTINQLSILGVSVIEIVHSRYSLIVHLPPARMEDIERLRGVKAIKPGMEKFEKEIIQMLQSYD